MRYLQGRICLLGKWSEILNHRLDGVFVCCRLCFDFGLHAFNHPLKFIWIANGQNAIVVHSMHVIADGIGQVVAKLSYFC